MPDTVTAFRLRAWAVSALTSQVRSLSLPGEGTTSLPGVYGRARNASVAIAATAGGDATRDEAGIAVLPLRGPAGAGAAAVHVQGYPAVNTSEIEEPSEPGAVPFVSSKQAILRTRSSAASTKVALPGYPSARANRQAARLRGLVEGTFGSLGWIWWQCRSPNCPHASVEARRLPAKQGPIDLIGKLIYPTSVAQGRLLVAAASSKTSLAPGITRYAGVADEISGTALAILTCRAGNLLRIACFW